MKIINKIWGMGLLAFLLILVAPNKTLAQQEGEYISEQEFYDELQPYGTWVSDVNYGNVWIPDVEEDFRPYATRGHWVLTEYGNTWVSDYPWGWATFHYGRWHFDDYYGWEWVPGSEWAPAWVTWRNGGGYYGWAPMSPEISMDVSFGNDDYYIPDNYWVFAPQTYITYPNIYNYYIPNYRVHNVIRRTTYIHNKYVYNNHTYVTGPRRDEIQRVVKRPVRVYTVKNVSRPSDSRVQSNTVNIYRPAVHSSAEARPSRVVDGAAYRQQNPTQRIGGTDKNKGTVYNRANANKLAATARTTTPDTRVVRVSNGAANAPAPTTVPTTGKSAVKPVTTKSDKPNNTSAVKRPAVVSNADKQQAQPVRTPRAQPVERVQQKTQPAHQQQQAQAREQQQVQAREKQQEQAKQQQAQAREQQQAQARQQQQEQAKQQQAQAREQQQAQAREQQQTQARQQQQEQARRQQQEQAKQQQQARPQPQAQQHRPPRS